MTHGGRRPLRRLPTPGRLDDLPLVRDACPPPVSRRAGPRAWTATERGPPVVGLGRTPYLKATGPKRSSGSGAYPGSMSFHQTLPHWFLVVVLVVVAWFVLKSLIKVAIIVGVIGLAVWLLWWQGWLAKITGGFAQLSG